MFEPLVALMPQVKAPSREEQQKLKIEVRFFWTVMALLVYLVCSQVPLYGVNKGGMSDPFYLMRVILASNKGTLMELGISPIITSGTIMQVRAHALARARARLCVRALKNARARARA
jgi:protein transport protein SEC61 subunit alpha